MPPGFFPRICQYIRRLRHSRRFGYRRKAAEPQLFNCTRRAWSGALGLLRGDLETRFRNVLARVNPSAPPGSLVTGGKQLPPGQMRRVNPG